MYESVSSRICSAETVALFMHVNPDGDCVGSSLAAYAYLVNLGKKVDVFLEAGNEIRQNLYFLPFIEVINAAKPRSSYDLGIALDCGSASRLGPKCYSIFDKCEEKISIDHHYSSERFAPVTILEPDSASTTQILYKIFLETDKSGIDANVALLLFAGLMTDSGGLSFSSATAESYRIASELVGGYGIDTYTVIKKLIKETSMNVFSLTNRVLSEAKFFKNGEIGIITFFLDHFSDTGTTHADTEGIINYIIDIDSVKLAISIAQIDKKAFKIGFRSKDGVDSSACAARFGGGGHKSASGCRIYDSYEKVLERLLEAAEAVIG